MERPRAADDFEIIRERLKELQREREAAAGTSSATNDEDAEAERRRQDHCEGAPPAWAPTIFLPQPTD